MDDAAGINLRPAKRQKTSATSARPTATEAADDSTAQGQEDGHSPQAAAPNWTPTRPQAGVASQPHPSVEDEPRSFGAAPAAAAATPQARTKSTVQSRAAGAPALPKPQPLTGVQQASTLPRSPAAASSRAAPATSWRKVATRPREMSNTPQEVAKGTQSPAKPKTGNKPAKPTSHAAKAAKATSAGASSKQGRGTDARSPPGRAVASPKRSGKPVVRPAVGKAKPRVPGHKPLGVDGARQQRSAGAAVPRGRPRRLSGSRPIIRTPQKLVLESSQQKQTLKVDMLRQVRRSQYVGIACCTFGS